MTCKMNHLLRDERWCQPEKGCADAIAITYSKLATTNGVSPAAIRFK